MAVTSVDWLRCVNPIIIDSSTPLRLQFRSEAHNALSPPSAISLDGLGLSKARCDLLQGSWEMTKITQCRLPKMRTIS
jgi:hypothetical protein